MHFKTHLICIVLLSIYTTCLSLSSSEEESLGDVNVVELSYLEGAASEIAGVTEESPFTTTTEAYLPEHPKLSPSDKFSVPQARGTERKLGNLTIYESPNRNDSKTLLITVFDIFGFHPHVKYISDELADAGFRVIIPDFFHGNPVDVKDFPQPDFPQRAIHLFNKNGSWVDIKPELLEVIKFYKEEEGVTSVGIYGYCWGGKIAVYASSDPDFSDIKAVGLVHPSRVTNEEAVDIKAPAILLPSNSEPDMIPFLNNLNADLRNRSEHHRFEDMTHGFAGARSDFSNPTVKLRVMEVIERLSKYFHTILEG